MAITQNQLKYQQKYVVTSFLLYSKINTNLINYINFVQTEKDHL